MDFLIGRLSEWEYNELKAFKKMHLTNESISLEFAKREIYLDAIHICLKPEKSSKPIFDELHTLVQLQRQSIMIPETEIDTLTF